MHTSTNRPRSPSRISYLLQSAARLIQACELWGIIAAAGDQRNRGIHGWQYYGASSTSLKRRFRLAR